MIEALCQTQVQAVQVNDLNEVPDDTSVSSDYQWVELFFVFFRVFNNYPRWDELDPGRIRRCGLLRKTDFDLDGRSLLWHFLESVVPSRFWRDRWLSKSKASSQGS